MPHYYYPFYYHYYYYLLLNYSCAACQGWWGCCCCWCCSSLGGRLSRFSVGRSVARPLDRSPSSLDCDECGVTYVLYKARSHIFPAFACCSTSGLMLCSTVVRLVHRASSCCSPTPYRTYVLRATSVIRVERFSLWLPLPAQSTRTGRQTNTTLRLYSSYGMIRLLRYTVHWNSRTMHIALLYSTIVLVS